MVAAAVADPAHREELEETVAPEALRAAYREALESLRPIPPSSTAAAAVVAAAAEAIARAAFQATAVQAAQAHPAKSPSTGSLARRDP